MVTKEMKRILIELCVPRSFSALDILEYASEQIKVATFEVDQTYPPVEVPPPSECALAVMRANQKIVVVRGHVEANQQEALTYHPYVTATWSDGVIEPFEQDEEWAGAAFTF